MESESVVDYSDSEDTLKIVADHLVVHSEARTREFRALSEKSQRIHSGFLYYRDNIQTDIVAQLCSKIYITLVRRIGATKDNGIFSGWKDLGYHLGLNSEEINYINNSKNFVCPTDTILQVYTQKEDGTIGKIIEALLELQRLDVIEGLFDPLNKLTDTLNCKYKNEPDQGYYSNNTSKESRTDIMRPKHVYNNLPEVLQWKQSSAIIKDKDPPFKDQFKDEPFQEEDPKYKHSVLLTYSEDGITVAQNIFRKIQNFCEADNRIHVICLENEKSTVLTNPEQYIRNYFEEVDYVIPILTEKYLNIIKSPTQVLGSSMQNVDCKYARFIYTLMSSHYINGTGCLNKKVRPILTQDINRNLISRLCMYPLLCVWTWENEFDNLLPALFQEKLNSKVI